MFVIGSEYTRDDIYAQLGGNKFTYLPTKNGSIVAACLKRDLNPQAPRVILCGKGNLREATGAMLSVQSAPIPVFLKNSPKHWEYQGIFSAVASFTSGPEFERHIFDSGRAIGEVTRVILLRPTQGDVLMDPTLIVSGIAAVLQAAQTWIASRDSQRAAAAFSNTVSSATSTPALINAANQLASLAPAPVLTALGNRVQLCWTKYVEILNAPGGSYLPQDIDEATDAVKACVCRELKRLRSVNGGLPPGQLSDWWNQYQCR